MKLAIYLESNYLILDADKAQAILEALTNGQLYTKAGWGDTTSADFTPVVTEVKPTVFFLDEAQLQPKMEPLAVMAEKVKASDAAWYRVYTEKAGLEKELKEVKAQLEAIKAAATPEGALK